MIFLIQRRISVDLLGGAAIGPTTILRMTRYVAGQGDAWPKDAEGVDDLTKYSNGAPEDELALDLFLSE